MLKLLKYAVIAAAAAVAAGCSTTKRLEEGQVLYTGVRKMVIENHEGEDLPAVVESNVEEPLSVKPNNPLWSPYVRTPLPTGLWAWNALYTERTTGFRAWLYRSLAKKPVLLSDLQLDQRMDLVKDILDNHGYFGSQAEYEVIAKRNPKKARVSYRVAAAPPWFYSGVAFPPATDSVTALISSLKGSSPIVPGAQYDVDSLSLERIRITNHLRNRSYYYFRPDYLEYMADTTRRRYGVDMRMVMAAGIPEAALRPYDIGKLELRLISDMRGGMDSLDYGGMKILYNDPLKLRPRVLARALTIKPGDPARLSDINATLGNLNRLGVFRFVSMSVTPLDSLGPEDRSLDMAITAVFDPPYDAELEVDFSHKSSSFIGPGLIFSVKHKNFLRGGEQLAVRLNAAYEWQTGNSSSQANSTAVNSYEFGVTTSLTFPRLVVPGFIRQPKLPGAKTSFSLGADILNRPKFFTMIQANLSGTWSFRSSPRSTHSISLLKFTYSDMLRTTADFDRTMEENRAIAESFRNHLIPSASYTYTYDTPTGRLGRSRFVWQSTFTTAGNLLSAAGSLLGESRPRKLLGLQYSQFLKLQTELKYYLATGANSTLATRFALGVGYAYDNSEVLPYSEQFYIGGANSIRAFTIRSIGPGSYRPDENDRYGYFDQTGDIRIEANVEYRFGIMGGLKGALFLDAGNIWLIDRDTSRPGGRFTLNDFFDRLTVGTGAGLRYDLSFLVLRLDLGVGIHLPYDTGKSGYYNIPRFKDGLGLHLAIGYPF